MRMTGYEWIVQVLYTSNAAVNASEEGEKLISGERGIIDGTCDCIAISPLARCRSDTAFDAG